MIPSSTEYVDPEVQIDPLSTIPQSWQLPTPSPIKSTHTPKLTINTVIEETGVPKQNPLPPKDKGTAAITILIAVTLLESAVVAPAIAYGIWQEYYTQRFPEDKIASWIGVLMSALPYLGAPAITWLCQTYTIPREAYVIAGVVTCVMSLIISAFMTSIPQLIATQGISFGIGCAFVDLPSLIILNTWFDTRRGLSYGVIFGGCDLLGVAYTFLAHRLFSTTSFRNTMLIFAALTAGLSIPALLFLKERIEVPELEIVPAGRRKSLTASKVEFQVPGRSQTVHVSARELRGSIDQTISGQVPLSGMGFKSPIRVTIARDNLPFSPSPEKTEVWPVLQPQKRYFQRSLFYVFITANILQSFAYYLPFIYLPTYAIQVGLGRDQGTIILAVANLAQVFGDLGFGKLSDKVHVNYLVIVTTGVCSLSSVVLWGLFSTGSTSFAILLVFALVFGTFGAGFISLWARMGTLFGPRDSQMIYSTLCAGRGAAVVLSGPTSQALIAADTPAAFKRFGYGSFAGLIMFVGFCNAAAAFMGVSAVAALHVGKVKVESSRTCEEKDSQ